MVILVFNFKLALSRGDYLHCVIILAKIISNTLVLSYLVEESEIHISVCF